MWRHSLLARDDGLERRRMAVFCAEAHLLSSRYFAQGGHPGWTTLTRRERLRREIEVVEEEMCHALRYASLAYGQDRADVDAACAAYDALAQRRDALQDKMNIVALDKGTLMVLRLAMTDALIRKLFSCPPADPVHPLRQVCEHATRRLLDRGVREIRVTLRCAPSIRVVLDPPPLATTALTDINDTWDELDDARQRLQCMWQACGRRDTPSIIHFAAPFNRERAFAMASTDEYLPRVPIVMAAADVLTGSPNGPQAVFLFVSTGIRVIRCLGTRALPADIEFAETTGTIDNDDEFIESRNDGQWSVSSEDDTHNVIDATATSPKQRNVKHQAETEFTPYK